MKRRRSPNVAQYERSRRLSGETEKARQRRSLRRAVGERRAWAKRGFQFHGQTMAADSGGTRQRHDGIARESLASALALPRGRDCRPVFVPRAETPEAGRRVAKGRRRGGSRERQRQLPLRGSVSFRERSCRAEGQKATRSQSQEAERGCQFFRRASAADSGRYDRNRTGETMGVSPGLSGKGKAAVPVFRFPRSPERSEAPGRRGLSGDAAPAETPERPQPERSRTQRRSFPEAKGVRSGASDSAPKAEGDQHGLLRGIGGGTELARSEVFNSRADDGRRFRWVAQRPSGIARESLASALALPRGRVCRPV